MNTILKKLLDSGDIYKVRSLHFDIDGRPVSYTTEYSMHGELGDFKWYVTWLDPNCKSPDDAKVASIYIHDARARLYFPAFLDTRIPPENRDEPQRSELMRQYGLKEYDKFDYIIASKGESPIKYGIVHKIAPVHCEYDEIHAIEEIWDEYKRTLV